MLYNFRGLNFCRRTRSLNQLAGLVRAVVNPFVYWADWKPPTVQTLEYQRAETFDKLNLNAFGLERMPSFYRPCYRVKFSREVNERRVFETS